MQTYSDSYIISFYNKKVFILISLSIDQPFSVSRIKSKKKRKQHIPTVTQVYREVLMSFSIANSKTAPTKISLRKYDKNLCRRIVEGQLEYVFLDLEFTLAIGLC